MKYERSDAFRPHPAAIVEFEEFYRTMLRTSLGDRLGSTQLREAYTEWARRKGAASLSFQNLAKHMRIRGHYNCHSNGAHYRDLRLQQPFECQEPTSPPAGQDALRALDVRITNVIDQMIEVRRALVEIRS